jgi:eukaryotic-like serine/threonine-protein kinase
MDATQDDGLVGRTIDHYTIVALIGAGGQGHVYRGRDERLRRDVAIKVLRSGVPNRYARRCPTPGLIEEARTLSLLNHPNVASIYDFVKQGRREYIVMEYVAGATLREILVSGPLPACEVVRLGAQIARGLAAAHAVNVVHRDIKPTNLKITSSGKLKILDFGVAKLMPAGAIADDTACTRSMPSGVGTAPYMSPEQIRGESSDERSDIFSAGSVLYEMATGYQAFRQANFVALINAVQYEDPAPALMVNPHLPVAVARVIERAMQKDPAARYQSAAELAESFRRLMPRPPLAGQGVKPRTTAQTFAAMGA